MPYTEATLREVMRHETLVPLSVFHRATKDTVFCGYNIPEVSIIHNLCKWLIFLRIKLCNILLSQLPVHIFIRMYTSKHAYINMCS